MSSAQHTPSRIELMEYLLAAVHTGDLETIRQAVAAVGNHIGSRGLRQLMVLCDETTAAVVLAATPCIDGTPDPGWVMIVEEVFSAKHTALYEPGVVDAMCASVLSGEYANTAVSLRTFVLQLSLVEVLLASQLEHLRAEFPNEQISFADECTHWVSCGVERLLSRVHAGLLPLTWLDDFDSITAHR